MSTHHHEGAHPFYEGAHPFMGARTHFWGRAPIPERCSPAPEPLPFLCSCGRSDWGLTVSVVELVLACLAWNSFAYCCAVEDSPTPLPFLWKKRLRTHRQCSRAGPCMSSSELLYLLLCSWRLPYATPFPAPFLWKKRLRTHRQCSGVGPCMSSSELLYLLMCSWR